MYSDHSIAVDRKVPPDFGKRFIMTVYRNYILGTKRRFGTARSLVHYHDFVREYLNAKRDLLGRSKS